MKLEQTNDITECVKDLEQRKFGLILSSSILIVLTFCFMGFMIHFTIKIWRLVWANDKTFPLMLSSLCLSLLTVNVFWIYTIFEAANPEWTCRDGKGTQCSGSIIAILPSLFLAVGVFLNLKKWIYFMLRIWAFIKVGFGVEEKEMQESPREEGSRDDSLLDTGSGRTGHSA